MKGEKIHSCTVSGWDSTASDLIDPRLDLVKDYRRMTGALKSVKLFDRTDKADGCFTSVDNTDDGVIFK